MKTKRDRLKFTDLPTNYAALCGVVVPRPIHDRAAYENALEVMEAMSGFEQIFNENQGDYYAVITDFVGACEDAAREAGDSNLRPPLESLKYLLEENDMTAADLSRLFGADRTLGAKILRGERNLTVPHLRILSAQFNVSPALFI